ncbi:uncharacterized protein LTR77_001000 [Saxophila tyrrhenica]|uniref:Major facilitator superfamily (MFS) profile domain-containing protein n=1 Tax=Saxophila tyrrhenica TaxID=1690608 RepID=A0AAV9PQV8_9PEZI|nr:hypothetical protein LTR77_001000 [Saxophila tyrrhenica]
MDETEPLLSNQSQPKHYFQDDGKHKIVDFDPNGDPENPMEWPAWYRWCIVLLLAFMAFTVTFTCIGIVPSARDVVLDLEGHTDKSASVLFVTIWELGEAAGPLFIAPLSEVYGRYPVYNVCNTLFILSTVITALSQDVGLLIFSRFLTGCAVASNVLNPAIVGDIFPSAHRGSAMSAVMLAPLLGGAIGPSTAGALAEATGWREIMWLSTCLAIAAELAYLFLLNETYQVPILQRRAARLRKETGDDSYRSKYDLEGTASLRSLTTSMLRPLWVFSSSVVLQILSLWGAMVFSFFYIMSTTLPDMLEDVYHFDAAMRGLAFLSFSAGSVFGILACNLLVDRLYTRLQPHDSRTPYPEARLPLTITGALILPFTVALYGWSASASWPVWVLLLSVVLQGFACMMCIVPMLTYVTDAFGLVSASALTAVLVTRCLAGTFLPLGTAPLVGKLGWGWGFTVLAGVCGGLAPIPPLVMRYGSRWRQRSQYSQDGDDQG